MQKSEQLLRLQLAGVPVPKQTSLDRAKRLDPKVWGDYVVVKPEISSRGRGVSLYKTDAVNSEIHRVNLFERSGHSSIVQMLVCNSRFNKIRIHVLFGEILIARRFRMPVELKSDKEDDYGLYQEYFITENVSKPCY
jgi:glutathione synthase/RimK-type ligase-like ATP-grasp enzyme